MKGTEKNVNNCCKFCLLIILWFSVCVYCTSKCEIQIGWGRWCHMDAACNLWARDRSPIFLLWNICGLYLIECLTVIIWPLVTYSIIFMSVLMTDGTMVKEQVDHSVGCIIAWKIDPPNDWSLSWFMRGWLISISFQGFQ